MRPRVVVFYGGTTSNHDLSSQTGRWVCQYLPREQYDITPVEVTPEGQWKVPLGQLPRRGDVGRIMDMLSEAVRPLPPGKALERLQESRPADYFFTVVRGVGGDDGALHSLGNILNIPVVGSSYSTSQKTSNKHIFTRAIEDVTATPYSRYYKGTTPVDEIAESIRQNFLPPLFVKTIDEEGSAGIVHVNNFDELIPALQKFVPHHDVLIQEKSEGTEFAVTLYEDQHGSIHTLPPTIIVPQKSVFYDSLSKRLPGRVSLHTPSTLNNPVLEEAKAIARDVYDELGCKGMATVDMVAGDNTVEVLEVNTIPSLSGITPLPHQLKTAGLHPTAFLDSLVRRSTY